jgi:hypothetical protein
MSQIVVKVRNMNCYCLCHKGLNPQTGCCSCVSIQVPDAEAPNVIGYEFEINELNRRLSILENKYIEDYETAKEIIFSGNNNDERLRKLEEHKKYQIDENRKLSKRVDELEKRISENELDMSCFPTFEYVNEYISKCLKEQINNRLIDYNSYKYYVSNKKPYQCLVCYGDGKIQVLNVLEHFEKRITDSQGRHFILCNTCEGKGIV